MRQSIFSTKEVLSPLAKRNVVGVAALVLRMLLMPLRLMMMIMLLLRICILESGSAVFSIHMNLDHTVQIAYKRLSDFYK